MEWVEIGARTVKEATDLALDQLGVDEQEAEIQVLEEPQPGLFGRTRGKARVRARVAPRPQPPKQERRDRRRGKGGSAASSAPTATSADGSAIDKASTKTSASDQPARSGSRRRGGRPDRTKAAAPASAEGDTVETKTFTLDEHVACVEEFVTGLVSAFGADGTVSVVEVDDETREVKVDGSDLGLLIGPRGLTLQAIHEVARTVVYRAAPDGQDGRVRIDIGGYRERRRQALEQFASKIAAEVVESGRARSLEPMSPPDRKIVHDAINGIEGVRTTSEGEEPRRRVVVLPQD